jgi:hypothetical protein
MSEKWTENDVADSSEKKEEEIVVKNKIIELWTEKDQVEYDEIIKHVETIGKQDNVVKRNIYARSELLIMKLQEIETTGTLTPEQQEQITKLEAVSKNAKLGFSKRNFKGLRSILNRAEELFRGIAVILALIILSTIIALPCIFLRPLDYTLLHRGIIDPYHQIAVYGKFFIGHTLLILGGVDLVVEGMSNDLFGKECVLACFSHSSTLDAFILTAVVPVIHRTLVSHQYI